MTPPGLIPMISLISSNVWSQEESLMRLLLPGLLRLKHSAGKALVLQGYSRLTKYVSTESYILVRREYPCNAGALLDEMFQAKQTREFSLIR